MNNANHSIKPTGARELRDGVWHVVMKREFKAPIVDVWAAVTEPERMQRWVGTYSGDPASGQVEFRMTAEGDDVPEEPFTVEECTPPHRYVVRSQQEQPWSNDPELADDQVVWRMTVDLTESDGTTTLTFAQEMTRGDVAENVGPGWEYYLDRLVAAVTGADVAAVDFDAYYPAQAQFYRDLFSGV